MAPERDFGSSLMPRPLGRLLYDYSSYLFKCRFFFFFFFTTSLLASSRVSFPLHLWPPLLLQVLHRPPSGLAAGAQGNNCVRIVHLQMERLNHINSILTPFLGGGLLSPTNHPD